MALGATGCSQIEASPDDREVASDEVPVFTGTVSEYSALVRACLEEHGIETADDEQLGAGGFTVEWSEDNTEIRKTCEAQVGDPYGLEDLSEDVLRERYEARVEQWECLVDAGLVTGDPMTFETFLDDYRRSVPTTLWEPTFAVTQVDGNVSPSVMCPRDTF